MRGHQSTPAGFFEGLIIDGRYQLMAEIGRGSLGRVYHAEQLSVNRDVAVKVLRRNFRVDDRMTMRFEREARAVAKLDHPNCLTLFDFGFDPQLDGLFMVTELVQPTTLRDCLDDMDEHSRLQVGYLIAEALKHAHAAGVVHRDLKPENVLISFDIDRRVDVKVVDFGLARLYERGNTSGEQRRLTRSGEICGSPRYLSPEQCRGALDVTPACDMYSFGVVLYELFSGRVPFDGISVPAVLTAHTSEEPPPMTCLPLIDVEQLIYELLAKSPADRPTAHEARDVFARNVNLTVSGIFDLPSHGLNEATLGSDAFDDGVPPTEPFDPEGPAATSAPLPPPAPRRELGDVLATREARIGMVVGACVTFVLSILATVGWLLLSG